MGTEDGGQSVGAREQENGDGRRRTGMEDGSGCWGQGDGTPWVAFLRQTTDLAAPPVSHECEVIAASHETSAQEGGEGEGHVAVSVISKA